ncbi:MAG: hydrogenase maturation protease [Bacteroidaceae bacterium]|nr:hydrogenase maturation protease [Bacteroidaceae bacterium]
MSKILVLGLGNLVLKDEGVGIHAVQRMQRDTLSEGIDILDGGTGGIFMIGTLQQYDHVIMIDATLDTNPPGTVWRLKPKYSTDYPRLMSAHEIGLKDMIDAMIVQDHIPDIDLVIVSARDVQEIGMELSPPVEKALPKIMDTVNEIIQELRN